MAEEGRTHSRLALWPASRAKEDAIEANDSIEYITVVVVFELIWAMY